MMTVQRYEFPPLPSRQGGKREARKLAALMHQSAQPLHVEADGNQIVIYAAVETEMPKETRSFFFVHNGDEMDEEYTGRHVGTVSMAGSRQIVHVFEALG